MIHYHGGHIHPVRANVEILQSRHGFVSFADPSRLKAIADICSSFALDNGAFSAWRQKKDYDFDGYVSWISEWKKHPNFDWCIIPDIIDGKESDNFNLVNSWPLDREMSVPVWHMHESLQYLELLTKTYHRVALGSSGAYMSVGTKKWWNRMAEVMNYICNDKGQPPCKLHGLRMLNPAIFTMIPLSSADSTNVAQNNSSARRWRGPYAPPCNQSRAALLVSRIEAYNSASFWNRKPTQKDLW